ncbi:MAG: COX15/CtaA family protein [Bacteroidota bacterium]|nr:COX15/CtaA family protein [Bacteroidota bacterium]
MQTQKSNRLIIYWLLSGCILIYVMVVVGGITRLTNSGLSMVEWNITGSTPPSNEQEWMLQFDKYRQSPEFKIINKDFTLQDYKNIFWWEYIHRFIGRFIGVVFLIPFLFFLIRKKFPEGFIKKMLILLLIGSLQGFIGWFMVKSGLQKNPHVSHYRLALHLLTAFAAFGFSFWYALDLFYPKKELDNYSSMKNISRILLGMVIIQIVYGAFVAGLKAGYMFPAFPKMNENWIANEVTLLKPVWKNFIEGQAGVQFIHRTLAWLVLIPIVLVYFKSLKYNLTPTLQNLIKFIGFIYGVQFLLGVFNILYGVPIFIGILHQTGAFLLFGSVLFLNHYLHNSALTHKGT